MNKFPLKVAGAVILALVMIGVAYYYMRGDREKQPVSQTVDPAFAEFISSYTAGIVSSGSSLRVVLTDDVADSGAVGAELSATLFSFSPAIKGKTFWLDRRTVEFRPSSRLASGTAYRVEFFLSKLIKVPESLSTFVYGIQTIPQSFEITVSNVSPYQKTDLKKQKIEGVLATSDLIDTKLLEKAFHSEQDGKALEVTWLHTDDGTQHHFTIENVARTEKSSMVAILVKGDDLGVGNAAEQTIEIPALQDFKLVKAKVSQLPSQQIILQFSDPLDEDQNLNGLISVEEAGGLDFDIKGNLVTVYPSSKLTGGKKIRIESGVRNIQGRRLKNPALAEVIFEDLLPAVRFTGNGSILPSSNGLVLPFEAVNLNAVDVAVFKIYERNMLQFLQVNEVNGNQELFRVGKRIIRKTVLLNTTGVIDFGKWNRYTLNLAEIIQPEPGAVYQVKVTFKKRYSTYGCSGNTEDAQEAESTAFDEIDFGSVEENSYDGDGYYEEDYYYFEGYDWRERDNPCHVSYYTANRFVRKNILASDLGITAKRGDDGKTMVFVNDIRTTNPMAGVEVELFDFQQQLIDKAVTSNEGKASFNSQRIPYFVIAKSGKQRSYLRLGDGDALSVSSFDVGGESVQKGVKGFLYGDRGVWRPGDSLYLTFILEDKLKLLPENHPVIFELQNPQGHTVSRIIRSSSENGFYSFATSTDPDAPTGNWTGRVKAGGFNYSQMLKIETIKPNRLKINLDFGTKKFTTDHPTGSLEVKWMHGPPGRNLKAEFDMVLTTVTTTFSKYPSHTFEDLSREFQAESQTAFEGYTDNEGKATVQLDLETGTPPPGFLQVVLRGKVFESSGNFSIDRINIPYFPYRSYVGIKAPGGERHTGILYFDQKHPIEIVTCDVEGNPVSRNGLVVNLFKLDWRWWWDNSNSGISNWVNGSYSRLAKKGTVNSVDGKATYNLEMKSTEHEYGRYYLRVCDPVSGHCAGDVIYIDEPGWYSRMKTGETDAPKILTFSTDKDSYKVGEKVSLSIPTPSVGRALISIENGTGVLEEKWVETQAGETPFSFDVTPAMAPNVYVNVTLLQPHDQTENELPVRLYGITDIRVEDPATRLEPVINMTEEAEPGKPVSIRISEKNKRKMTYTIAVVDEGLLDITRFKTPHPWSKFYAKEALGVRTWDVFDHVIGAYGSRLERVLTIGGDVDMGAADGDPRANRFKPVVRFFGPFTSDGTTRTHSFIMPQYIGSVRTMVVAGYDGSYGSAEKVTPVRKPLMVLTTLPRVLGPGESLKLPVTLFASGKGVGDVRLEVKTSGPLRITGERSKSVNLSSGELTVDFNLEVNSQTGVGRVEVQASAGNLVSSDVTEIEVRNPNPAEVRISESLLEAGQNWQTEIVPFGTQGSNSATIEVSNMPPVNLRSRLRYLMQYPYGCVEQTTSAVFPQLFLSQVKVLTPVEEETTERNVKAGIDRLKGFMLPNGGFAYWPGAGEADLWGSSYAGHFLLEASSKGYYVPAEMISKWKKFQRNRSEEWRRNTTYPNNDLQQAYRLYTLALAGSPEIGAMNRLREESGLSQVASWMLSAAYARISQPEAARKIINGMSTKVEPYRELSYSYGSDLRDRALILETLVLLKENTRAYDVLRDISSTLSNSSLWLSTQETAMCLKAIASFAGMEKRSDLTYSYTLEGKTRQVVSALPVSQIAVPLEKTRIGNLSIHNTSGGILFARMILEGTPPRGDEKAGANNLEMEVRYVDAAGSPVDVSRLPQGTEFVAEVSIRHTGTRSAYANLALTQVFPSGWEVNNLRLNDDEALVKNDEFDYQDIRDDRVYTYFNLPYGARKTFRVMITAGYAGNFYVPAVLCEAMYDKTIFARTGGFEVEVIKDSTQ